MRIILKLLSILVGTSILISPAYSQTTHDKLEQAVQQENWDQAITLIDQLIQAYPDQRSELLNYRENLVELQQTSLNPESTEPSYDPEKLARHLSRVDAIFYGASWCGACKQQKMLFGDAVDQLPYVECATTSIYNRQAAECTWAGVEAYPTWVIDGQNYRGVKSLAQLAELSGFR